MFQREQTRQSASTIGRIFYRDGRRRHAHTPHATRHTAHHIGTVHSEGGMYTEGGMVCRAQEAHYIPLSHVAEGEPDVPPQPVHKSDTVRSCLSNQAKSSRLLSVTEAPA